MPDRRKHRGPHPQDRELFDQAHWPQLQRATRDLSWLLSHGYSIVASLKLVGDRHRLVQRQRLAVRRSACSDRSRQRRIAHQAQVHELDGQTIMLDGFNVLTTVEAALAGGVILAGRDGVLRDLASMHGSYRQVEETRIALRAIGATLQQLRIGGACWLLDRPVSNSGRLKLELLEASRRQHWGWTVELVDDPDRRLIVAEQLVATSDSQILDRCRLWIDLPQLAFQHANVAVRPIPMGSLLAG